MSVSPGCTASMDSVTVPAPCLATKVATKTRKQRTYLVVREDCSRLNSSAQTWGRYCAAGRRRAGVQDGVW